MELGVELMDGGLLLAPLLEFFFLLLKSRYRLLGKSCSSPFFPFFSFFCGVGIGSMTLMSFFPRFVPFFCFFFFVIREDQYVEASPPLFFDAAHSGNIKSDLDVV